MNSLDSEFGLLMSDSSTDIHDVRDELRTQSITLNAQLKRLDNALDYSAVLRPYLEDTMAPSLLQIDRMRKQIVRMTTLRDDAKNRNAKYRNAKNRNNRGPPHRQRRRLQKSPEVVQAEDEEIQPIP